MDYYLTVPIVKVIIFLQKTKRYERLLIAVKKFWSLPLVLTLVLILSSCGSITELPEALDTEDTRLSFEASTFPSETFADTDVTDGSVAELPLTEETEKMEETEPEASVLWAPVIREDALDVPPFEIVSIYLGEQKNEVNVTGINYIADSIESVGQENCYLYTPAVSGTHRFHLADIKHEGRFSVYLYDSEGCLLQCINDVSGGDGINEVLTAGQTYRIIVAGYSGNGAYTLKIGAQKPTTEISAYVTVSENLEFAGQVNNYSFTTSVAGKYRFEVISDDTEIMPLFYLYDNAGNCIASGSDLPAGGGFSAWLEADSVYTFSVVENGKTGFYQFAMVAPLEALDISGYGEVINFMRYTEQYHTYTFTASESRDYCFGLGNANSGFSVDAEIVDESGYILASVLGMTEGECITVALSAGETYTLTVAQSNGVSQYSLFVD